jgi:hypothetical protein
MAVVAESGWFSPGLLPAAPSSKSAASVFVVLLMPST